MDGKVNTPGNIFETDDGYQFVADARGYWCDPDDGGPNPVVCYLPDPDGWPIGVFRPGATKEPGIVLTPAGEVVKEITDPDEPDVDDDWADWMTEAEQHKREVPDGIDGER